MLADLERYSNRGGAASSSGRGAGAAGRSSMPAAPSSSSSSAKRLDSLRPPPPAAGAANQQQQQEQSGGGFKAALDKLLIVDFFFVLFALAWLVVGVATNGGGEGLNGSSSDPGKINGPLLSSWFALWPMVFQPAIGILMAGALVSGGVGWLRENKEKE